MIYHIRKYTGTDLKNILSIWEKASNLAHPFLPKEFLSQERYNIQNIYIPAADTWVADVNGSAVGFISIIGNVVGGLFLDPDFHGLGIGKALMVLDWTGPASLGIAMLWSTFPCCRNDIVFSGMRAHGYKP